MILVTGDAGLIGANFVLEWLHRLASEPGRLWKQYLVTNTLFIVGAARQLLSGRD